MCIAILKPENVKICKRVLQHCYAQNPHGAGFAVPDIDNNRVLIRKGFFSFREFWQEYRQWADTNRAMLIHFRVATSGVIDGDNCHPWRIDDERAMVHNGVLEHKLGLCHDDVSDTGLFAHNILKPTLEQAPNIWKNPAFQWAIEESIGSNNKVVILDKAGDYVIFNEDKGEWDNGSWFSNNTFKEERKKKIGTTVLTQRNFYGTKKKVDLPENDPADIVNQVPPPHFFTKDKKEEVAAATGSTSSTTDLDVSSYS